MQPSERNLVVEIGVLRRVPTLLATAPAAAESVDRIRGLFQIRDDDRILTTGPLYHNAVFITTAAALLAGAPVVVMPRFGAQEALEILESEAITWMYAVPTMMQRKMTADEIAWAVDQTQKTPDYVAVLLQVDSIFADYTEEAKKIDGKIPVLYFLSEENADSGKAWLVV